MKRQIIIYFKIFLVFAILFSACEIVEEPFIEGNPFSGVYDSDLPIRKILIEEYTGFKCPNCPRAAEEMEKLQERYGGHIVPMAIHVGYFASVNGPDDPDFNTVEGEEIGNTFMDVEVTPFPKGIINRTQINGDYLTEYEDWSTHITDILSVDKFADIGLEIIAEYDDENGSIDVMVEATGVNQVDSKLSLSVMILESHIIGRQKEGSEYLPDYEHNHVLRAGLNGTWGEEISNDGISPGQILSTTYSDYMLSEEWVPGNLILVAFVYNTETLDVIQAEEVELINE